jgi:hypothetical protein
MFSSTLEDKVAWITGGTYRGNCKAKNFGNGVLAIVVAAIILALAHSRSTASETDKKKQHPIITWILYLLGIVGAVAACWRMVKWDKPPFCAEMALS